VSSAVHSELHRERPCLLDRPAASLRLVVHRVSHVRGMRLDLRCLEEDPAFDSEFGFASDPLVIETLTSSHNR
jgi:hypothetical protein